MMIRASLLGAVAALVFAAPAAAQDFIIVNATLVLGDSSEPFEDGVVVVERGRVTYAGPAAGQSYATGQIIDVNEAWVTPGLVAAVTDLGLVDVDVTFNVLDLLDQVTDALFVLLQGVLDFGLLALACLKLVFVLRDFSFQCFELSLDLFGALGCFWAGGHRQGQHKEQEDGAH